MARILIVDDDPDVVEAVSLFLSKEHTVSAAYNRSQGMKAVTEQKPDLLILDVIMEQPDDGIAMAQELRRKGNTVPILMLTSIAKVTGQTYGRDSEMVPVDDFQEKPVDPATLVAKVNALLSKKEA